MSKATNGERASDELRRRLAGLTTPSPRITDHGIREQSTLLAWLLLFMFGWVLVMVLTLRLVVMREAGWSNPELIVAAANAVCVLVAYDANRRGYYLFAAVLTVGALLAGIIIGTHLSLQGALEPYYSRDEVHILAYLLLPLILGALLLPLRLFVVSLFMVGAGLLAVPIAHPHVSWAQVLNGPLLYVGAVGLLLLFVAYVNGVTRRRQYRQLEWREEGYRILFEQSPDAISLVSMDGAIETINQAGLTLFGYLPGEIEGLHASATYANPGDRVALMEKVERGGGLQDEPVRMRKKDGSLMDCLVTVWIRRDSSGQALGFQSVIRDVTERLRVEEDLRLKGELLDLAHDGILLVDPGGEIVYANEATSVLTGYPLSSLVGMNIRGLNTREGAEQVPTRITTMLRQGYAEFETIWVCSDGRRVDVEVRSHTIQSRGRTLFLSVARDVSRRRADEAELRLRSELLDAAQDMVFLHDLKGRLVYANAAVGQLLGYNAGDLVSMDARSLEPSEDASRFRDRMAELFVRHSLAYETDHLCKNGELLPVEVRARIIESQDVIYVLSIARDMRSRKTSEAALREGEEKYRSLFELSRDAIYLVQPDGKFINVNQAWLDLLGCTRDDVARYDASHWYADHDGRERYLERMSRAGTTLDDEVKLRRKDGSVFDCQRRIVAQRDKDGNTVAYQGVMRDVTEKRNAERELRESGAKYRALFERSMDAVCIVAADGTLLEANQAYLDLYGYEVTAIGTINVREHYVNPAERDEYLRALERDGVVIDNHAKMLKTDGTVIDCVRSSVAHRDVSGRIISIQTVTRDITEDKRREMALADELTRRRILVEQSRDGIVVLDEDGNAVEANRKFAEMLGYSPQEVLRLHVSDWDVPTPRDRLNEMIRTVDESGDLFETRHRRKDGSVYDVEISTNAAVFAGRKLIFCVCRDISARKRAERELRESEEKYRALFEQSMDAVAVYSPDGVLLDANPAHLQLFGLTSEDVGRNEVLAL
jgi:PAS domain S-box-containing protein